MTSVDGPKSEATQTTGEAVVTFTEVWSSDSGSTTVTITGTAEQVRTAQRVMNAPAPIQVQRSGVSGLV